MAQGNYECFPFILPQAPPHHDVPITTLTGLLDLLDVLADELAAAPGIIPILSRTLRDELDEVLRHVR
jgi:hypothetical protein